MQEDWYIAPGLARACTHWDCFPGTCRDKCVNTHAHRVRQRTARLCIEVRLRFISGWGLNLFRQGPRFDTSPPAAELSPCHVWSSDVAVDSGLSLSFTIFIFSSIFLFSYKRALYFFSLSVSSVCLWCISLLVFMCVLCVHLYKSVYMCLYASNVCLHWSLSLFFCVLLVSLSSLNTQQDIELWCWLREQANWYSSGVNIENRHFLRPQTMKVYENKRSLKQMGFDFDGW